MATAQVQQAKTKLSEVIDAADLSGAQIITKHGVESALVLSVSEYHSLASHRPDALELLLHGPGIFDEDDEFFLNARKNLGGQLTFERE